MRERRAVFVFLVLFLKKLRTTTATTPKAYPAWLLVEVDMDMDTGGHMHGRGMGIMEVEVDFFLYFDWGGISRATSAAFNINA